MSIEAKERFRKMAMEIDRDAVEFAEEFARENSVLVDYDSDPFIGDGYVIFTNPRELDRHRQRGVGKHLPRMCQFNIKAGVKLVELSSEREKASFRAWIATDLRLENRVQLLKKMEEYE